MPRLFGTDGIRGTVGEWPLVPEFALRLGQAAGAVLASRASKRPSVIVGRDTRQSGPMLQSALTAGLLSAGVDVLDADVITTPGVSWMVRRLNADAGAVISASHNPVEQNGIKFFGASGIKLPEAVEEEIETLADPQPGDPPPTFSAAKRLGRVMDSRGMHERYIESLLAEHPDLRLDGVTLVVDCANGAASRFAPDLFSRLGAQVTAVHASPSGLNINAEAGSEFVRQRPEKIGGLVRSYEAKFGIAFDGDADRVIFLDEQGGVVDGDHMLGMLARYFEGRRMLMAHAVVTTTMRNSGLKAFVEKAGLKFHETPVGDKYVVEKLMSLQTAVTPKAMIGLGGEQSGHVVLLDSEHSTGDGMRTALFVIRAFVESRAGSMSEFAAGIGKTPQVIASADVGRGPRLDRASLDGMEKQALDSTPGLTRINLRYSGTEPKFRAMLESDGQQSEEALAAMALRICRLAQSAAGADRAEVEIQNCTRGGLMRPH
ncbi:MAG: phosphoglucosamine mutase [Chloroflexi bacterium]|nr:phosphoglucosamine mutase [Chloroflexota bacterium]